MAANHTFLKSIHGRILFVLILLLGCLPVLNAQSFKAFSNDPDAFISDLSNYFNADPNITAADHKVIEQKLLDFQPLWDEIPVDIRQKYLKLPNAMLKLRAKSDDFLWFINAIEVLQENQQIEQTEWIRACQYLSEKNRLKDVTAFIHRTIKLLSDRILYESLSVQWIYSGGQLSFNEIEGIPVFFLKNIKLTGFYKTDSTFIYETSGRFYPLTNHWDGVGGKVDFARAGFNPDEVFITLKDYQIILTSSRYKAEQVEFHAVQRFPDALTGRMEDKIEINATPATALFPRFECDRPISIPNLFPNMDFTGRYIQSGGKMQGGCAEEKATLLIRKDKELLGKIISSNFNIKDTLITSANVSATLYLDGDSIYHPSVAFKFNHAKRMISFFQSTGNSIHPPFVNSYHKINMYFDNLSWYVDSALVDFSMFKLFNQTSAAKVESTHAFSEEELQSTMRMIAYSPLYIIKKMVDKYKTNIFSINELMGSIKLDTDRLKSMILQLASMGFVIYEPSEELFVVQEKLLLYVEAPAKKRDYDHLIFQSLIQNENKANATLSLATGSMVLRGIDFIPLSTTSHISIEPTGKEIQLQRNRDFSFSGYLRGGSFNFYANHCRFIYDEFKIDIPEIDSLVFFVKTGKKDVNNEDEYARVLSSIEQLSGTLNIDEPQNKSGLKKTEGYPVFYSHKPSYVYYDEPAIQRGDYLREVFYYQIDSLRFNAMNNFSTKDFWAEGALISGDIFPIIREPLSIMKDYSLGFTKVVQLPVYKNKGMFEDTLSISRKGLIGNGKLTYSATSSYSKNIIFCLDSLTVGKTESFEIAQTAIPSYPWVKAAHVSQKWQVSRDTMYVKNQDKPFRIFNVKNTFDGELCFTPTGLTGKGSNFYDSLVRLSAPLFLFNQTELSAQHAFMDILHKTQKKTALMAEDYEVLMNFEKQHLSAQTQKEEPLVSFPLNQYEGNVENMTWEMTSAELKLFNMPEDGVSDEAIASLPVREQFAQTLPGILFVSKSSKQRPVRFQTTSAVYQLDSSFIQTEHVHFVPIADVLIIPDQGQLTVERNARIQPLTNASVVLDTLNFCHKIYQANVNIQNKDKYQADGLYDFVNEVNHTYVLNFKNIMPNSKGISMADAEIPLTDEFTFSPRFAYFGKVNLTANRSDLSFKGYVNINQKCENVPERSWFSFSGDIRPDSVYLKLPEKIVDTANKKIGAGFYLAAKSGDWSMPFFHAIVGSDLPILTLPGGILRYDEPSQAYRITKPGNNGVSYHLGYYEQTCLLKGYGHIDLQVDLGEVQYDLFGQIGYAYDDQSLAIDAVLAMNFLLDEKLKKHIVESITSGEQVQEGENMLEIDVKKFYDYLFDKTDSSKAVYLQKERELYGYFRENPEELNQTFVFSDIKFRWDETSHSLISSNPIGIRNIGEYMLNRYITGNIQIIRSRKGDVVNMYFKPNASTWYFFSYFNGFMGVLSSDETFNESIEKMKKKVKKQGDYQYDLAPFQEVNIFTRLIRNQEAGIRPDLLIHGETENP